LDWQPARDGTVDTIPVPSLQQNPETSLYLQYNIISDNIIYNYMKISLVLKISVLPMLYWLVDILVLTLSVSILTVIFQVDLDSIGAKDDGGGGNNWSSEGKAPVKSSPPTNQHHSCCLTNSVKALKENFNL